MAPSVSTSANRARALRAIVAGAVLQLPLGGYPDGMEYGYKPTDDGAPDTAGPPGEPDDFVEAADSFECFVANVAENLPPPYMGFDTYACAIYEHGEPIVAYDKKVIGITIEGTYSSAYPDDILLRFAQADYTETTVATAYVNAELTSDGWKATISEDELGNLNDCYDTCSYYGWVQIPDEVRASATACDEYLNTFEYCLYFDEDDVGETDRRIPPKSVCEPGAGRFLLVPRRTWNRDQDERATTLLRAMQLDGTGTLTAAAWITSIAPVRGIASGLQVVPVNGTYRIGADDTLDAEDPLVISPDQPLSIREGRLSGSAPFFVEKAATTGGSLPIVDLQWSCEIPASPADLVADVAQGYSFSLGEIGCMTDSRQRFTIRPTPTSSPTSLSIELYGDASLPLSIPLDTGLLGDSFLFKRLGLRIEGKVVSYSANLGMLTLIESVTWNDQPACSPGFYLLPPEK